MVRDRIDKLRALMRTEGLDGMLLIDQKDRRWATGFASSVGAVLVAEHETFFFTDSRYIQAARLAEEKAAAADAVDVWYEAYHAALEAAENNAGGAGYAAASGFVWPMPGYTYITCYYGDDGHRGIDIAGSGIYGEPIVAAAGGTVAYSGWMDSYGYCVFIDHGDGYSTRYAHASALACSAGDTVSAGQTIAYVGSTGNSTGPHLHFEVLQSGSTTNPFEYF